METKKAGNVSVVMLATALHNYANEDEYKLYRLVDMHGGGELIDWIRYARRSGDYSFVDGYIEVRVGLGRAFVRSSRNGRKISRPP